jgi:RNA polymerase subunit RPABC4/transcription elongation factor Spt4
MPKSNKVCKKCKIFVEKDKCPICNDNKFSTYWQGRISVIDPKKSKVASFANISSKGEYSIKVK